MDDDDRACPHCGARLRTASQRFCVKCGQDLSGAAPDLEPQRFEGDTEETRRAPEDDRAQRTHIRAVLLWSLLALVIGGGVAAIVLTSQHTKRNAPQREANEGTPGSPTTLTSAARTTPTTATAATTTTASGATTTVPPAPAVAPLVTSPPQPTMTVEPVKVCATSGPGAQGAASRVPGGMRASLPAGLTHLSFYANNALTVLAPAGWSCQSTVAEDGGAEYAVEPSVYSHDVVTASTGGACAGCSAETACPFFPSADSLVPDQRCPSTAPKRQREVRISSTLVEFEDPPGVQGPSPFTALGVMIYRDDNALLETCRLPAAQRATCSAILNDFVKRYDP